MMLWQRGTVESRQYRALSMGAGVAAGVMATTVGMGGPPIALLYARRSQAELRGSLATVFLVGNVASTGSLAWAGHIAMSDLAIAAVLILPVLAGLAASRLVVKKLPGLSLTRPVSVLVVVMGGALIARSFF